MRYRIPFDAPRYSPTTTAAIAIPTPMCRLEKVHVRAFGTRTSKNRPFDRYYCATFAYLRIYGRIAVMKHASLPVPHEQRKIDALLIALAKKQPVSAKPAPIASGQSATGTAHPRVFFST
jgi:hypothetical protein